MDRSAAQGPEAGREATRTAAKSGLVHEGLERAPGPDGQPGGRLQRDVLGEPLQVDRDLGRRSSLGGLRVYRPESVGGGDRVDSRDESSYVGSAACGTRASVGQAGNSQGGGQGFDRR